MKKTIFVNATALREGGALTIFNQFLKTIKEEITYDFYIFSSMSLDEFRANHIQIITVDKISWIRRLRWDFFGMKQWSKSNNIIPNLVISMQNTGVMGFPAVNQIVYLHQSIPFQKHRWNLLKVDERIYWFYYYLYVIVISRSINKNTQIVCQTKWVKDAIFIRLKHPKENIHVIKPEVYLDKSKTSEINLNKECYNMFYPAAMVKHKNHELLIEALNVINSENPNFNFKLLLTANLNEDYPYLKSILKLVSKCNLESKIIWLNSMPIEEVYGYYNTVDLLVFPSYLETFGLPLVEGASFGLPILVSDLPYSREVIGKYEGASFLPYNNPSKWAKEITSLSMERKKYNDFNTNYDTNWNDFVELINKFS